MRGFYQRKYRFGDFELDSVQLRLRGEPVRLELDVSEIESAGWFRAELDLPEGRYVVELDQLNEFSPCREGGIAAHLVEHGNKC
jgi:hypothetical protein